jgi:hypothetical protein
MRLQHLLIEQRQQEAVVVVVAVQKQGQGQGLRQVDWTC